MASANKNTRNQGDALQTVTDEKKGGSAMQAPVNSSGWADMSLPSGHASINCLPPGGLALGRKKISRLAWNVSLPLACLTASSLFFSRYDARLLLDRLPSPLPHGATESAVASPESVGWSDIPSDMEDTFFLTPDETEEYHRQSGGG